MESQGVRGDADRSASEQGLGDVIQFCRYLPLLLAQEISLVFEVMPSLRPLLRTLPGAIRLVGRGELLPPVDYHCPLLSLPLALDTRLETIPAQVPYLSAEPERITQWKQRLRALPRLRVGIAWQVAPVSSAPPRAADLYPVTNESYASQIARDWNMKASGVG
jgi:hypothetical protein